MEQEKSVDSSLPTKMNILADHYNLYETGEMYDCTLRAGNEVLGIKEFKCHKVILGSASLVFQTMLFGSFKEATLNKDEPIEICNNVAPDIIDAALRFIYGGQEQFGGVLSSVALYRFAHMMNMETLLKAVEIHLKNLALSQEDSHFATLDLWVEMSKSDDHDTMEHLWEHINDECENAFQDPSWLTVSAESVRYVLQSKMNQVPEEVLYWGLVHWSLQTFDKAEIKLRAKEVRGKIEPYLSLIRFGAFSQSKFLKLITDGECMLSHEERMQVMTSILQENPDELPAGFCRLMTSRMMSTEVTVRTPYLIEKRKDDSKCAENYTLCFSVDREVLLKSIRLHQNCNITYNDISKIFIKQESIKTGNIRTKLLKVEATCGFKQLTLKSTFCLKANRLYSMFFELKNKHQIINKIAFLRRHEKVGALGELTVTFFSRSLLVAVKELVFEENI